MARSDASGTLTNGETSVVAFDGVAFERAYRTHADRLRAVAFHVLHDRDAAQDAVHTALTRVWSAGAYRPERGELLPFLIACVRREAIDVARGASRRRARELRAVPDATAPDELEAIDPVEARRLQQALEMLPPAQREIIQRAYYAQRTLAEIAGESGVPLGTVKSRLSAALRRLHDALSPGGS
jgi:RNA polymerase sigma-70 factor (ECF subfamily)